MSIENYRDLLRQKGVTTFKEQSVIPRLSQTSHFFIKRKLYNFRLLLLLGILNLFLATISVKYQTDKNICYLKKKEVFEENKTFKVKWTTRVGILFRWLFFGWNVFSFLPFFAYKNMSVFFLQFFFYVHLIIVLYFFVSHNMPLTQISLLFLSKADIFFYFFQFTSKEKVDLLINQIRPL